MTGDMFGYASKPIMAKGDANFIACTMFSPRSSLNWEISLRRGCLPVIHIDLNAYEIAKTHPVTLGMVADPKRSLALLADILAATMTPEQKAQAHERTAAIGQAKAAKETVNLMTRRMCDKRR